MDNAYKTLKIIIASTDNLELKILLKHKFDLKESSVDLIEYEELINGRVPHLNIFNHNIFKDPEILFPFLQSKGQYDMDGNDQYDADISDKMIILLKYFINNDPSSATTLRNHLAEVLEVKDDHILDHIKLRRSYRKEYVVYQIKQGDRCMEIFHY